MATSQGNATVVQAFLEAAGTWGTRSIATGTKFEVDDYFLDDDSAVVESRALYAGLGPRALYQMGIKAAGAMAGEARYEGLAKLMACIHGQLGTFALTNVAVQTGVYRMGSTAQKGVPSLSIEDTSAGVLAAGGDCSYGVGICIPKATFEVRAGTDDSAMLRYNLDLLGKDVQYPTSSQLTAGVPAASQTPVFFNESIDNSFSDGSGDAVAGVNVIGVKIEIQNMLAERYLVAPNGGGAVAGTKNMQQPLRNGRVKVTWTITKEFTSVAIFNAARSFTDASGGLKVRFEGGTIATSSPATNYALEFNTVKAKCISGGKPRINEWGIIEQVAVWQAYQDVTDGMIKTTIAQSKASEAVLGA